MPTENIKHIRTLTGYFIVLRNMPLIFVCIDALLLCSYDIMAVRVDWIILYLT